MTNINIRRLAKDIRCILRDPIENIFYKHDEENITRGYAMIIGPADTPYENGYYLFEFTFPEQYPFLPPIVKYYTNDGTTRFNPNFYVCGKVCLSVLNTWKGEGWTSCQTIKSVLLALQCALNDKPLLNEPGITEQHRDYNNYNNMLSYKNIEIAILGLVNEKYLDKKVAQFQPEIFEQFAKNREWIRAKIDSLTDILVDNTVQKLGVYASQYLVNFTYIKCILNNADHQLSNYQIGSSSLS